MSYKIFTNPCLSLVICFILTGCGGQVIIPPEYLTDEMGETTRNFNGAVADASTAKEFAFQKTRRSYNKMYKEAYLKSGTTITFAPVEKRVQLLGMSQPFVYTEMTMTAFSSRDMPNFQAIPDGPSVHPVWKTAEHVLDTAARWGFGYLAVDSIVGGFKSMNDNAGNHYAGPVQMTGSYNTQNAGRDSYVMANNPKMDQGQRTDSSGCSNGNCAGADDSESPVGRCDEAWVHANVPGCSGCDSFLANRCTVHPGDPGFLFNKYFTEIIYG